MRALVLLLLLIGVMGEAQSQTSYSLDPAQAPAGTTMNLRVDDTSGCFPFGGFVTIERNGNTVTATGWTEDFLPPGGCPPEWTTPLSYSLGAFTSGSYEVEVVICTNSPFPDPCTARATLPLTVFGNSGVKFTVPTTSGAIAIGLALAIMAIGALGARRGL